MIPSLLIQIKVNGHDCINADRPAIFDMRLEHYTQDRFPCGFVESRRARCFLYLDLDRLAFCIH